MTFPIITMLHIIFMKNSLKVYITKTSNTCPIILYVFEMKECSSYFSFILLDL